MPSTGLKKKDTPSRMDANTGPVPQLSNEMQLSIMNKVKSGELTIDDALQQAKKDTEKLLKQKNPSNDLDFKTKMLCSIEKGIIKRQLPFSAVKSCDDGVGSRFSISFKGHHDYELEATSLEDKHKMMQLVNKIIYGNIYTDPEEDNAETHQQPQASQSLREGVLLLHRGGLASFKWVKYEVQLHAGQLTLIPFRQRGPTDGDLTSSVPISVVIHLSDGDTSVQKPYGFDTFTLITHKNQYQFKVPGPDETAAPGAVQRERDAWVQAIDRLCLAWKRKSRCEHMLVETKTFQHPSITEDTEDNDTDPESSGRFDGASIFYPPVDYKNADPIPSGDTSQSHSTKPVPKPRLKSPVPPTGPDVLNPIPSPTSPCAVVPALPSSPQPSPRCAGLTSSSTEPLTPVRKAPPPPNIPAPPPLPFKLTTSFKKKSTKAFHWDLVGSEKISRSFWILESSRKIKIDTSRLYEQFAVKDLATFGVTEPSNTQHIMLNQKIAHNFNIFLKSFPVQPGELKDKLFIINEEDGGLSDEHITSLRRYVPTMDDVEMYKSHKGPDAELHVVDRYMMEYLSDQLPFGFQEMVQEHERDALTMWSDLLEMCNIPYLSTQLDLLLTLRELPISMNDLQPLINQKIRMCTQLNNCRSFVSVLEYLLAIGNYLNENAGKQKAKGFRLSSLTKLSQLRGRDRKFTLLHALVEQIMLQEPHLAIFTQELAEFETVPGASIKGLTAEVDVLKNELQKVIQYRKTSKKRNSAAHHPNFSKDLKMVIDNYNLDLTSLTKTCEEMKKLYSVILVKFGEPVDQDSQEFFGVICQFLHDFKRAYDETV